MSSQCSFEKWYILETIWRSLVFSFLVDKIQTENVYDRFYAKFFTVKQSYAIPMNTAAYNQESLLLLLPITEAILAKLDLFMDYCIQDYWFDRDDGETAERMHNGHKYPKMYQK